VSLLDEVRALLGETELASFRLMGEDLVVLGPERLRRAAEAYEAELEKTVPPSLRERLTAERANVLAEAHAFLVRNNVGIHARIRGYLTIGRRVAFEYPWPIVAILGIGEVLRTIRRVHLFGLVGSALERFGFGAIAEAAERSDDILRRTNRGIFADSIPTVLYALRCRDLRTRGDHELAELLLRAPPPIWMDADSMTIVRGIDHGLGLPDPELRFRALSELTLVHFAREQAIFSFHMGGAPRSKPAGERSRRSLGSRLFEARSFTAPRIVESRGEPRLIYARYPLPPDFSMRDHDARVRIFGDAFVRSITKTRDDYAAAVEWVEEHYG